MMQSHTHTHTGKNKHDAHETWIHKTGRQNTLNPKTALLKLM